MPSSILTLINVLKLQQEQQIKNSFVQITYNLIIIFKKIDCFSKLWKLLKKDSHQYMFSLMTNSFEVLTQSLVQLTKFPSSQFQKFSKVPLVKSVHTLMFSFYQQKIAIITILKVEQISNELKAQVILHLYPGYSLQRRAKHFHRKPQADLNS